MGREAYVTILIVHLQRDVGAIRSRRHRLAILTLLYAAVAVGAAPLQKTPTRGDLFDELFKQGQAKNGNLKTLQGANVAVSRSGDHVTVEDALVTQADVVASNGVVHEVDRVLLPPAAK